MTEDRTDTDRTDTDRTDTDRTDTDRTDTDRTDVEQVGVEQASADQAWPTGRTLVRAAIAGLLVLVAAVALVGLVRQSDHPADSSAEAGFARDMLDHHAQAVDLATLLRDRTQDTDLRYLATDIALTQSNQMGQMQGWLNLWGLTVGRSGEPMQWMAAEHTGHGTDSGSMLDENGLMPGMATQDEVNEVRSLPTDQADIRFLQLMIEHHRGGVSMAQAAIDLADDPVVLRLARTVVAGQQIEIELMQDMLTERGADQV